MNLPELARKTLEAYFEDKNFEPDKETKRKFSDKKACFVTLTKHNELRGCIGSLEARQELWKDVQENSINAAFHDFRFMPLAKDELNEIKIEVSALSKPERLEYKNEKEILNKINSKMGIILKNGSFSATFLPQVWEQIPSKVEFLQQLSLKAGLDKNAWKLKDTKIFYYFVDTLETLNYIY